jgi:hypothetical protein
VHRHKARYAAGVEAMLGLWCCHVQDAHLSMLRKDMSLLDLELLELKLKLKMGEGYSKSPVQVGDTPVVTVTLVVHSVCWAAHAGCHVSKWQAVLGLMCIAGCCCNVLLLSDTSGF